MRNLKKLVPMFFLAFALFLLPSVSALTIDNTTFFSSRSNYTIFVDSMTLSEVNVTNLTISFYDVNSTFSNFTNTNATYDARADFYGLQIGLIIHNVNTSTDLFTSASGNQSYNATFTPLQILRIMGEAEVVEIEICSSLTRNVLNLTIILFALIIVLFPIGILFKNGTLSSDTDPKTFIGIFVMVIIGVAFIQAIASQIITVCP